MPLEFDDDDDMSMVSCAEVDPFDNIPRSPRRPSRRAVEAVPALEPEIDEESQPTVRGWSIVSSGVGSRGGACEEACLSCWRTARSAAHALAHTASSAASSAAFSANSSTSLTAASTASCPAHVSPRRAAWLFLGVLGVMAMMGGMDTSQPAAAPTAAAAITLRPSPSLPLAPPWRPITAVIEALPPLSPHPPPWPPAVPTPTLPPPSVAPPSAPSPLPLPPLPSPPPPTPPPLPSAPPSPPLTSSLDALNARFHVPPFGMEAEWTRSGRLPAAGVLVHVFDARETSGRPWKPIDDSVEISASLLYAAQRANGGHNGERPKIPTFNWQTSGLVLRPGYTRIRCGCDGDCGGSAFSGGTCEARPCEVSSYKRTNGGWSGCVFGSTAIGKMLAENAHIRGYNEMVVDASFWSSHLPSAVEAIFGDAQIHSAFVGQYGLHASDVPLATLDLDDFEQPFKPYAGKGRADPHFTRHFRDG